MVAWKIKSKWILIIGSWKLIELKVCLIIREDKQWIIIYFYAKQRIFLIIIYKEFCIKLKMILAEPVNWYAHKIFYVTTTATIILETKSII